MKRTLILILVLILAAAGLLALSLNTQTPNGPTLPVSLAQTTLSLTKPSQAVGSSSYRSDVLINTRGNKATAVQIELSYNPQDISISDITPGTFFSTPVELFKKIDSDNGRVSYALGISLGQKGVAGQGVVATLVFKGLKTSGTSSIDFTAKSLVSAEGVTKSVLSQTLGTKFSLSPTPTLQPTSSSSAK